MSWADSLSREDFEKLKKLVKSHKKGDVFIFKGGELLQEYAYYVVEYLKGKYEKEQK